MDMGLRQAAPAHAAHARPLAALLMAGAILAVAVVALNVSGGAASETLGVVKSVSLVPHEGGSSERIATVLLADGTLVQARVLDANAGRPGQEVYVRVSHRILSHGVTYEVLAPKEARK